MKIIYYGRILRENPIDRNTICSSWNDSRTNAELEKAIGDPKGEIVIFNKLEETKVIYEDEISNEINKNDVLVLNGRDCVVTNVKYEVNRNTLLVYTDYHIKTIDKDEEEYNKLIEKIKNDAIEELNTRLFIKKELDKKWFQFWKR